MKQIPGTNMTIDLSQIQGVRVRERTMFRVPDHWLVEILVSGEWSQVKTFRSKEKAENLLSEVVCLVNHAAGVYT